MRMKNKISFCIQFLVFVLFMSACNQHKTEQTSNGKLNVNLDSIIQIDIDLNTRENCKLEKLAFVNSLKEKKIIDSVDWKQELDILTD